MLSNVYKKCVQSLHYSLVLHVTNICLSAACSSVSVVLPAAEAIHRVDAMSTMSALVVMLRPLALPATARGSKGLQQSKLVRLWQLVSQSFLQPSNIGWHQYLFKMSNLFAVYLQYERKVRTGT